MNTLNDEAVVAAFVAHLRENGHPGLSVESRPDVENRKSSDIDAIAGAYAIEHTSVDTIENQRRDGTWFSHVAESLEVQFKDVLPFRLRLVFPYEGIAKGQDWNAIRFTLAAWVSKEAPRYSDGSHQITAPGIPFEFHAIKDSKERPGLIFVRIAPNDTTLASRLYSQLSRKAAKLQPYKAKGMTTLLLVDSGDIALMSYEKLLKAIQLAFSGGMPAGVDQLWYVDTSIEPELEFWDLTSALARTSGHSLSGREDR